MSAEPAQQGEVTQWLLVDHMNGALAGLPEPKGQLHSLSRPDLHDYMPRLYPLPGALVEEVKRGVEQRAARQAPPIVCAILSAKCEGEVLLHHLSSQVLALLPDGRRHFFRFYDPRIMAYLAWILSPPQWATLIGPSESWELFDGDQGWRVLQSARPAPSGSGPLRLERRQYQTLRDLAIISACLNQWSEQISAGERAEKFVQVSNFVANARHLGLTEIEDIYSFTLHSILVHPGFHHHPEVREALARAVRGECRYQTQVQSWDDDTWAQIAAACQQAAAYGGNESLSSPLRSERKDYGR